MRIPSSLAGLTLSRDSAGRILCLLPIMLVFMFLVAYPATRLLWDAFGLSGRGFSMTGIVLTVHSKDFWDTTVRTIWYSLTTTIGQIVLGVFAAAIVQQVRRGRAILAMLLFLPYAVPSIIVKICWEFLIKPQGLYAALVSSCFSVPPEILIGDWSFFVLVIVSIWQFFPFVFIAVLFRMRRIPPALYRSADADGVDPWKQFWSVTLPQMRSVVFALVGLRFVFMFTKFDLPFLLFAKGSMIDKVSTVPIFIYQHIEGGISTMSTNLGMGAAVIMASTLMVIFLGIEAFRWTQKGSAT